MARLVLFFGDKLKIDLNNNDIIISNHDFDFVHNKFINIHEFDDIPIKSLNDFDKYLNSINKYSLEYELLKSALPTFYSNTFLFCFITFLKNLNSMNSCIILISSANSCLLNV